MATRDLALGEEVTWTYGNLSNEELWLWYGFVPRPALHAGTAVTFQLPEGAFRAGLESVARGDSAQAAAARHALLARAGAFTPDTSDDGDGKYPYDNDGIGGGGGDVDEARSAGAAPSEQRMLQFDLRLGLPPKVLAGIAGIMCCAPEEAIAVAAAVGVLPGGGGAAAGGEGKNPHDVDGIGGGGEGEGEGDDVASAASPDSDASADNRIAFVDIEGRVAVRLAAESRRRAGRYVAYILEQVEPVVCGERGGDDDDDEEDDRDDRDAAASGEAAAFGDEVPEGVDAETWTAACRLRSGARGVFRAVETQLDDASLLARGEWIDAAVADLLVAG